MKTVIFSLFKYNKFTFGDQVVSQFVVFEHKRLFSIIFFYFHKSEKTQDRFHTHAFNAWSFKLFGEYSEYILHLDPLDIYKERGIHTEIKRRTKVIEYFPRESFHKIGNSNGCMTLLISGPWKDGWKEYIDGEIVEYNWGREKQ